MEIIIEFNMLKEGLIVSLYNEANELLSIIIRSKITAKENKGKQIDNRKS